MFLWRCKRRRVETNKPALKNLLDLPASLVHHILTFLVVGKYPLWKYTYRQDNYLYSVLKLVCRSWVLPQHLFSFQTYAKYAPHKAYCFAFCKQRRSGIQNPFGLEINGLISQACCWETLFNMPQLNYLRVETIQDISPFQHLKCLSWTMDEQSPTIILPTTLEAISLTSFIPPTTIHTNLPPIFIPKTTHTLRLNYMHKRLFVLPIHLQHLQLSGTSDTQLIPSLCELTDLHMLSLINVYPTSLPPHIMVFEMVNGVAVEMHQVDRVLTLTSQLPHLKMACLQHPIPIQHYTFLRSLKLEKLYLINIPPIQWEAIQSMIRHPTTQVRYSFADVEDWMFPRQCPCFSKYTS